MWEQRLGGLTDVYQARLAGLLLFLLRGLGCRGLLCGDVVVKDVKEWNVCKALLGLLLRLSGLYHGIDFLHYFSLHLFSLLIETNHFEAD